jgi:hypothetical protein
MARYHGGRSIAYIAVGAGTSAVAVSLSQWSLNSTADTVDVTAFGDSNKQYVQGLKDMSGSLSGWFDSADDWLFAGSESTTGVTMALYPSRDLMTCFHAGPALMSAAIDVPVSGAISIKSDWKATGPWTRNF